MSSSPTTASAPALIVVPREAADEPAGGELVILGLSLGERVRLAAKRAGYAYCSTRQSRLTGEETRNRGPLVVAPDNILAETGWLKAAAAYQGTQWAAAPDRLILVPRAQSSAALGVLNEESADFAALLERLTRVLGAPAPLPGAVDPMIISGPPDRRPAEKRLMRALVKDTDGFMARHVDRPISLAVSRRLASTPITPNQMTLISVAIGVLGTPFFLSAHPFWQTIGALMFLAHSILDGCDGELARLKFKESRWGGVLDFWGDNVVHSAVFACMGIGWSWAVGAGWPLLLGAAAVLGTLGSASLVYWRTMRPKRGTGPLYTSVAKGPSEGFSRVLDALSRRDFIYGVVVLALFGWVDYFLAITAVGAPVFFFLLIYLAIRESRLGLETGAPSGT